MKPETSFIEYSGEITADGYKLVCFPFAGSGASHYAKWNEHLSSIEVLPVQLPGRENRIKDEPYINSEELTEKIVNEIEPYLQTGNFSIFGHSMGGILGFEVAKKLEKRNIFPDICFISGTSIEGYTEIKYADKKTNDMNDDEFIQMVSQFGAIDENNLIFKYSEIREIYLKILRADFNVIESYEPTENKVICPIVAMCGNNDPSENIKRMCEWEKYTESEVSFIEYNGNHFYLDENLDKIGMDIKHKLLEYRFRGC